MDRKHLLLLSYFASHKGEYKSENDIPVSITSEFEDGMELPTYLYQLQLKKLIVEDRKRSTYYTITDDGYEKINPVIESKKKQDEVSKLEFEQLKLNVEDLRNKYFDYTETQKRSKKALAWSIVASVATALTLIILLLQWMSNKPA